MTYIIAEIGQNHNGSVTMAKALVDMAADLRPRDYDAEPLKVDAVKLTKRDLDEEYTRSFGDQPYTGPHSFGATYHEHRQALELTDDEHAEIADYARERDLDFIVTVCSPGATSVLPKTRPDYVKVASRDLTNYPLLHALDQWYAPKIISTGMAELHEVARAVSACNPYAIMHCVSSYPAEPHTWNLRSIETLKELGRVVGYSDHSIGIVAPVAAVAMGAAIIEKHITLDRSMNGTDQAGSLERDGLYRMVRDIRALDAGLGVRRVFQHTSTQAAKRKLARSLCAREDLPVGHVVQQSDLVMLSPGDGLSWMERDEVLGQTITHPVIAREQITLESVGKSAVRV